MKAGDRVCHRDGYPGTVRYIGPLEGVDRELVGVEWDEQRGKHDGTFKGKSYFSCPLNHGSFVASTCLLTQISLLEALESRYGGIDPSDSMLGPSFFGPYGFVRCKDTGAFVNVRQCDCSASEDMKCIASAVSGQPPSQLQFMFPNLVDLSLHKTLLSSWNEVFKIIEYLPQLERLNVAHNLMGPCCTGMAYPTTKLQCLNATNCKLSPCCPAVLLNRLPMLQELFVNNNQLDNLVFPPELSPSTSQLRLLGLEGNQFSSLQSIASALPSCIKDQLCHVTLTNNPLKSIGLTSNKEFPQLSTLLLRSTPLDDWDDFSTSTALLPSLKCVSFTSHTFPSCLLDTPNSLERLKFTIALLPPTVNLLNGSQVRSDDHRGSHAFIGVKFQELLEEGREEGAEPLFEKSVLQSKVLKQIASEYKDSLGSWKPVPQRLQLECTVHLLVCQMNPKEKAEASKKFFEEQLLNHFDDFSSAVPIANKMIPMVIEVRWDVMTLKSAIFRKLNVPFIKSIFHVDRELMKNPGAVQRGLHVRDLHPESQKLHRWQITTDDVLLVLV